MAGPKAPKFDSYKDDLRSMGHLIRVTETHATENRLELANLFGATWTPALADELLVAHIEERVPLALLYLICGGPPLPAGLTKPATLPPKPSSFFGTKPAPGGATAPVSPTAGWKAAYATEVKAFLSANGHDSEASGLFMAQLRGKCLPPVNTASEQQGWLKTLLKKEGISYSALADLTAAGSEKVWLEPASAPKPAMGRAKAKTEREAKAKAPPSPTLGPALDWQGDYERQIVQYLQDKGHTSEQATEEGQHRQQRRAHTGQQGSHTGGTQPPTALLLAKLSNVGCCPRPKQMKLEKVKLKSFVASSSMQALGVCVSSDGEDKVWLELAGAPPPQLITPPGLALKPKAKGKTKYTCPDCDESLLNGHCACSSLKKL